MAKRKVNKKEPKTNSSHKAVPRYLSVPGGSKPGQWRRFLLGEDLHLDPQAHARFAGKLIWAEHGDLECTFSHPRVDERTPNFFNYPRFESNKK
jgi:hypothetical protein